MSHCASLDPSLIAHAQAGDTASRDRLMAFLDPLVRHLTHRYRPENLEYEDALQEARLAVLMDLPRFQPERLTFSRWVCLTVRQAFWLWWRRETGATRRCPGSVRFEEMVHSPEPSPYPAALDRAFLDDCLRIVPPSPKSRLALSLYLAGEDMRAASRRLGLQDDTLRQRVTTWVNAVSYRLGLDPTPPYRRHSPAKQRRYVWRAEVPR